MKAAIINANNEVLNVIVWDDSCTAPPDTFAFVIEDDVMVEPGWVFQDGSFSTVNG
jgi:hypothetical protein